MIPVKNKINSNVLGVDIGHGSIKIAQAQKNHVSCYGYTRFDLSAINASTGVIEQFKPIAQAMTTLINNKKGLHGEVTSKTIAFSIPNSHTYNRILQLPKLPPKEMYNAVVQEVEQSIPRSIDELQIDYDIIQETSNNLHEVLMMAVPKEIIESYMQLFNILNFVPVLIKSNIDATVDAIIGTEDAEKTSVIIDFGSITTDLAIYDRSIRVTGTLNEGGQHLTNLVAKNFQISRDQANVMKMLHGIDSKREGKDLLPLFEAHFKMLFMEIRKIIRFFEDRSMSKEKVQQIIAIGGGANMPGVAKILSDNIGLPVKIINTIPGASFENMETPSDDEVSLFATAFGLSLAGSRFIHGVQI